MNLTRLLNTIADCRTACRLAGFSPAEADRIVIEGFKDALNRIPHRPYHQETDHADRDCEDERTRPAARGD